MQGSGQLARTAVEPGRPCEGEATAATAPTEAMPGRPCGGEATAATAPSEAMPGSTCGVALAPSPPRVGRGALVRLKVPACVTAPGEGTPTPETAGCASAPSRRLRDKEARPRAPRGHSSRLERRQGRACRGGPVTRARPRSRRRDGAVTPVGHGPGRAAHRPRRRDRRASTATKASGPSENRSQRRPYSSAVGTARPGASR